MKRKAVILILVGLAIAALLLGATIVGYLDMSLISAPGNPSAGYLRLWSDSGSTTIKCKTSSGAACYFTAAAGSALEIQTGGVDNASQSILNLVAGSGITLNNTSGGNVSIASSGGGVTFQTNGVSNGSQTLLNLAAGSNVTLTDNGSGQITIAASTGGGGSVSSVGTQYPLTGGAITSTGTVACVACSVTVATGRVSLGTSAISSGACATVVTATATNVTPSIAYTDLVIGSPTTTQLTSSGHPFAASQVGAWLTVTSGTGFTTGRYRIMSVSGTTATMDRSVGTASSTGGVGVLSGDVIGFSPDASIKAVTGYAPTTAGGLTIAPYPTADTVNFDVCNWSTGSITPGSVNINWSVRR